MKFEATVQGIRALVQLAEFDAEAPELPVETYKSQRGVIWRRVASGLRERYQSLLEAGRSPVIVAIERGGCSGCHLRLPTMLESRARLSPVVHTCPNCGRLLYAPELLARPASCETAPPRGRRRRALPPAGFSRAAER
jgi:predicted  nucleic acid-binding Zn-ribbon protein